MSWLKTSEDYSNEELKPLESCSYPQVSEDLLIPIEGNLDDLFPQESLFPLRILSSSYTKHRKSRWTPEEDRIILEMFVKNGGKWKLIANNLNNRHADSVKNRFYGTIKKKLSREHKELLNRRHIKNKVDTFQQFREDVHLNSYFPHENEEFYLDNGDMMSSLYFNEDTILDSHAKNIKLKELYSKMAAIQAVMKQTKGEISQLFSVNLN